MLFFTAASIYLYIFKSVHTVKIHFILQYFYNAFYDIPCECIIVLLVCGFT